MPYKTLPTVRLTDAELKLVKDNVRLAYSLAIKMDDVRLDEDDRKQAGLMGLMRAAQLFDPTRGVKFSTFAYPHIVVSIRRAEAGGDLIHVPYYHKYDGVDPGDSKSRAKLGRYAKQAHAVNSLTAYIDEPMWVEDDPCARLIDREEAEEKARAAAAVLAMLSPRDYEIITSRLIDGESLKRVGARVKLSGERVRHLELAAIDKIRNHPAFARYAKGA